MACAIRYKFLKDVGFHENFTYLSVTIRNLFKYEEEALCLSATLMQPVVKRNTKNYWNDRPEGKQTPHSAYFTYVIQPFRFECLSPKTVNEMVLMFED